MDFMAALVALGFFNPPMADVRKLPDSWVCTTQRTNCGDHLARLRWIRAGRGYDGGQWDDAIARTEFLRDYWVAAQVVHDAPGERWTREALQSLKDLIGAEKYMEGWKPALMPDRDQFVLPGITGPPATRGGANDG